jgi:undecaprenyl-diphosphatase
MRYIVNTFYNFDIFLFGQIFQRNGIKIIDKAFYWISRSADGIIYVLFIVVIPALDPGSGIQISLTLTLAFTINHSIYKFVKQKVKRDRPFKNLSGVRFLIQPPDRFSFPSGHTASAIIFALILSLYYPVIDGFIMSWASFVGISRVYLGVHYPSDVLAGLILGTCCSLFSILII